MNKPEATWNEEDECWEIKLDDYLSVKFWRDHEVIVCGSLLKMEITFDSLTEEKGIQFRSYEYKEEE